ncbi:hypothetical protein EMPS_09340 [Entomortierella parvispora]|uniref:BZIP domain-containing protein n=1 Tax=Entomortierella parvispora TaxID=205924 RepID=A0A9P3HI19_9FUNG|nr:hypothetical protein EMPS_09340 [Entomortierella parvispora]
MDPSSSDNSNMIEDDSILSFLTTDFLESQTTANPSPFDSSHFFDPLPADSDLKYQSLLHPPSPPTSVGTYSESSGSPHNSASDSCDEGSGSDVAMDSSPLEYWQYVYSDLTHPPSSTFPLLGGDLTPQQQLLLQQQQQQSGSWPLFPNVDGALMQPLSGPGLFDSNTKNSNTTPLNNTNNSSNTPTSRAPLTKPAGQAPPSPVASVKSERRSKKAKKLAAAPSQPTTLPALAPLKPLVSLAPQPQAIASRAPVPPSPPVSVHDAFTKQSPPLSPALLPAPATAVSASTSSSQTPLGQAQAGAAAARRPSIVPALTPSLARSNPVLVKSTLIPDEKPQSEAVMTAHAKRQERLIKNRAAALLSRKRKREHINLLESHTDLLKMDNQELKERVTELEENVKVLTEERDSALQECERLQRQIIILSHRPHSDSLRVDMDIERNARGMDTERGLNSKATGVVFMIILFSFALFNLPGGKLETLMVGGRSVDRPRIGSSIVGRALNSYSKNPTISGQVRDPSGNNNMTDLIVFSDNRALQTWLGHQPVTVHAAQAKTPVTSTAASAQPPVDIPATAVKTPETSAMETETETVKSVGFVAQSPEQLHWAARPDIGSEDMIEPDRDAWLYCSNLLYSLRSASVSKAAGSAQATNGEIRRPRLSLLSPLDGVLGSNTAGSEKSQYPPWMPNHGGKASADGSSTEQRYLRLDVEVTSSRVVSGKGLGDHEQVIRFPIIPVGMFDNSTATTDQGLKNSTEEAATSLVPSVAKASSTPVPAYIRRRAHQARVASAASAAAAAATASSGSNSRVGPKGGVVKTRRIYDNKDTFFKVAHAASRSSNPGGSPLAAIKEEPMEIYIKEEPMD